MTTPFDALSVTHGTFRHLSLVCTCNISQGLMRAAVPGLDGPELSKALILQKTSNGGLVAMMDRQRSWPREAHSRRPFSPSLFR